MSNTADPNNMAPKQAGRQAAGRKSQQIRQMSSSGMAVACSGTKAAANFPQLTDLVLIRLKSSHCWA